MEKPSDISTRLGFSTKNFDNKLQECPYCKEHVINLHQPFKYDDYMCCAACFHKVQIFGIIPTK
jgi:hypothetical protein